MSQFVKKSGANDDWVHLGKYKDNEFAHQVYGLPEVEVVKLLLPTTIISGK